MGTDVRLALDLAEQRGADLRAEAERFRLARLAQLARLARLAGAGTARPGPADSGERRRAPVRPGRDAKAGGGAIGRDAKAGGVATGRASAR